MGMKLKRNCLDTGVICCHAREIDRVNRLFHDVAYLLELVPFGYL
jgi:hypothetical protein